MFPSQDEVFGVVEILKYVLLFCASLVPYRALNFKEN